MAIAAAPTRQNVYTPGDAIVAAEVTANEDAVFTYLQSGVDTYADSSILNADINSSANIQSDKINLTSIAQNVANTGTFSNTGNATITGTLTVSSTLSVNGVENSHVPSGVIMAWTTDTAPTGWLLCYGQAVSRTTYDDLFAVISTVYGVGDGSTTFNVPDLRGRFILGQDDMGGSSANRVVDTDADTLGNSDGDETKTIIEANLPSHTHTVPSDTSSAGGTSGRAVESDGAGTDRTITSGSGSGSGTAMDIMPNFMTLNFIIKT